ncbi:MAG: ATP-dependent Clp protease ATP-binding subunit [Rhabdochlamydiaceae bacterium]|nr:ATP-dependent Clp protease ATP-binding subunit [Rhabdochlamydiaceae bacterium]
MTPITSYLKSSRAACTAASIVLCIQVVNQIASRFFTGTSSLYKACLHSFAIGMILSMAHESPICTLYFMTALNLAAICIKAIRKKAQDTHTTPDFLVDMSEIVKDEDILTANDGRVQELQYALKNSKKPNVVLVGLPGVGKSALVAHVAALLKKDQIDPNSCIYGKRIFFLDHNNFLSETRFVGELNGKIKKLLQFCQQNPDVYIFIDELHLVLEAGKSSNSNNSVSDFLKVPISERQIRIIGASTPSEYYKRVSKDTAFERRFQNITIKEPTSDECLQMLLHYSESRSFKEDYPNVKFTQEALVQIILGTNTIRPDIGQPDKARSALADIAGRCDGEIDGKTIWPILKEYLGRNPQQNRRPVLSDYL